MPQVLDIILNLSAFLIIISIIAFIHEFGHYFVAKKCRVKIEVFSIGFGPEIFGWCDRSMTRWKISLFPLGGYVKMFGDANVASVPDSDGQKNLTDTEQKIAFHTKALYQKASIVAAGPLANFIFAIIILTGLFYYYGQPYSSNIIEKVVENSVAEKSGLSNGDKIIKIDNYNIENFEQIKESVNFNPDQKLKFLVERQGKVLEIFITPVSKEKKDVLGNISKVGEIGILQTNLSFKNYSLFQSFIVASSQTWHMSVLTLKSIGQIIIGKRDVKELKGPISIARYSGQSLKLGINMVLWFMAILSINLGLVNLLPIPVLDGGHLLFYLLEAIRGRPLAEKFQQYGFKLGFILIISLMIFSTFNDLESVFLK